LLWNWSGHKCCLRCTVWFFQSHEISLIFWRPPIRWSASHRCSIRKCGSREGFTPWINMIWSWIDVRMVNLFRNRSRRELLVRWSQWPQNSK
jgi:hypothetical protein